MLHAAGAARRAVARGILQGGGDGRGAGRRVGRSGTVVALGRAFAGRWFPVLGGAAAGLVLVGVLSPLDLPVVDTANFLGYVLWSVWLIAFAVAIVFHIYLGTAAEPGTFGSMIRGTVTRPWARLHHGRWYRQVTGDASEDPSRR